MADKLYGIKIWDRDNPSFFYYTELEAKTTNLTHKNPVASHVPLNSTKPYHTKFGKQNNWTGSISACWENNSNGECLNDYTFGDVAYRINFVEWLHNGKIKMLQLADGFVLSVRIMEDINVSPEFILGDPTVPITFNYEECKP